MEWRLSNWHGKESEERLYLKERQARMARDGKLLSARMRRFKENCQRIAEGKDESAGIAAAARAAGAACGAWSDFYFAWLPETDPRGGNAGIFRAARTAGIFRVRGRHSGGVWRRTADRGPLHARCRPFAGDRNGGGHLEGA